MNPTQISSTIRQGIADRVFPGAVAYIVEGGNLSYYEAFGNRMIEPDVKPMHRGTIFDIASLTKPMVISTLALRLVASGDIELRAPVRDCLPEFSHPEVTVHHLLTHTSGLPAWRPLYMETESKDRAVKHLCRMPLEQPPGAKVEYSCLGYILLGALIERAAGKPLDSLADEQVFQPLAMSETRYNPPESWIDRIAATEDSNSFEKRIADHRRYDWREGVNVGAVHDENAHYLGGVSGNAGLFSTAEDVSKYCRMIIGGGDGVLTENDVAQMAAVATNGLNELRSVGWIILEDGSLYHTGFTGTSIRINLQSRSFAVLLTNRVHPSAFGPSMVEFRAKFHQEIF
ncbi:MAG: serine hydrolase [Candidatus Poribacteria bacterium]|nr:serine hydrolase [Candidatus Poribacteria bacterium]